MLGEAPFGSLDLGSRVPGSEFRVYERLGPSRGYIGLLGHCLGWEFGLRDMKALQGDYGGPSSEFSRDSGGPKKYSPP